MPTSKSETVQIDNNGVISYKETTVVTDGSGNVTSVSYKRGVYGPGNYRAGIASVESVQDKNWTPSVVEAYNAKIQPQSGEPTLEGEV
jgi:hypothetical protein